MTDQEKHDAKVREAAIREAAEAAANGVKQWYQNDDERPIGTAARESVLALLPPPPTIEQIVREEWARTCSGVERALRVLNTCDGNAGVGGEHNWAATLIRRLDEAMKREGK